MLSRLSWSTLFLLDRWPFTLRSLTPDALCEGAHLSFKHMACRNLWQSRREPMCIRYFCSKICCKASWSSNFWNCNECVSAGIAVFGRCSGWTQRSLNKGSLQSYLFWRFGLQRMNKIDPFVIMLRLLVYFMVLLSVTACRRKHGKQSKYYDCRTVNHLRP